MLEDELTLKEDGAEAEIYNNVGDLDIDSVDSVSDEYGADFGSSGQNINESIPLEDDLVDNHFNENADSDLLIEEVEELDPLEEVAQPAEMTVSDPVGSAKDATDQKSDNEAEETSNTLNDLLPLVEVIAKNQKVAAENMQLIGSIQIALIAMLFGGFVIYCFLHKLW